MYSLTHSLPQHLTVASNKPQAPAAKLLGKNPGTHCIRCWVGPRADLDILEKRKVSCPYLDPNSTQSSHSLVTIPTELSWLMHGTINHGKDIHWYFQCNNLFNKCHTSKGAGFFRDKSLHSGFPVAYIWKGGIKPECVLLFTITCAHF